MNDGKIPEPEHVFDDPTASESLTKKVDRNIHVWMAALLFFVMAALCLSGTAWVIVKMWKDLLQ